MYSCVILVLGERKKMLARRRFRSNRQFTRRKPKYQWTRQTFSTGAPGASLNTYDLLGSFKTAMGITFNLPDIVIWRIILKVSIRFHYAPATLTASDGFLLALWCQDQALDPAFNAVLSPNTQKYQMWDQMYTSEQEKGGENLLVAAGTANTLYKEYDIKTHRKLENIGDTQILQIVSTGNAVPNEISYTMSLLMRLP
jgi:hypothetical protein